MWGVGMLVIGASWGIWTVEIVTLGLNLSCSVCWLCVLRKIAFLFGASASLAVKVKATNGI